MSKRYDEAVATLYQAAPEAFVAERKRLAAELKTGGDKPGAANFAKLPRPPLSAWVVNQLWWHARTEFEELFETAHRLRSGKRDETGAHRKAIAKLSGRAAKLLTDNEHAATDATLRRVSMTLSGLAASGSFAPELAGALSKDRDPPGFEAFGIAGSSDTEEEPEAPAPRAEKSRAAHAEPQPDHAAQAAAKRREHAEAERARAEAAAEKQRLAAERAKREAARRELQLAVREAKDQVSERQHAHAAAAKALTAAERDLDHARAALEKAEAELAATDDE